MGVTQLFNPRIRPTPLAAVLKGIAQGSNTMPMFFSEQSFIITGWILE
jgi:hypothetical protein